MQLISSTAGTVQLFTNLLSQITSEQSAQAQIQHFEKPPRSKENLHLCIIEPNVPSLIIVKGKDSLE